MNHRVSPQLILGIVSAAEKIGLEANELLSEIHLTTAILHRSDERISHQQLCVLWQTILDRTGEEAIGLRLAAYAQPTTYDVVNYVLECSPNLGEALARLSRYIRLVHEASVVRLETDGAVTRITHAFVGVSPPLPAATYQWVMANLFGGIRRMTGSAFVPLRVGFQQAQPANPAAFDRFFQTRVQFLQPVNELCLDSRLLQQPLLLSNDGLVTVLDRYATESIAKLPQANSLVNQVQREIQLHLQSDDPKLDTIAQALQLSSRTLQRKLKEAGTSYQVLLDEVRRELAIAYVRERSNISFRSRFFTWLL
ncbi:AraC family transcriptional regulator ligand-binding domain-containing protein [Chamaesiphon minutus]|uniref:DNA-binding domain-containing protein, AraC-type n=1 Tax=Chamaesiphon minutus (strain ATCC 27169 / PCC 6605) TaxID=1173020 RepID=K9URU1_CHAP6|nr:AraC family transcriptional regulator ligand-binding domain-containing protein [Chamaesiphon minutus]AFY96989.1 DNA-binding domain-containing protein, AraC-type [Chamaesiphon minutus PCC 6605]